MNISIEKIKFAIKAFESNGQAVKENDLNVSISVHKMDQDDHSVLFRFSAFRKPDILIPVHWDGNLEIHWIGDDSDTP
jgi:hypothetical protein